MFENQLILNKHLSQKGQLALAKNKKDENKYNRLYLATFKSINVETQLSLAKDNYVSVLFLLAENRTLCKDAQMILAKQSNPYVKGVLLSNSSLDKDVKKILFNDKSPHVTYCIKLYLKGKP